MSNDRCPCGAFAETEAALERIGHSYGVLTWYKHIGILEATNHTSRTTGILEKVVCKNACDLPAAIMELRNKVDPPKPKEREWQIGDMVLCNVAGVDKKVAGPWIVTHSGDELFRHNGGLPGTSALRKDGWRNLTIEAELAGEER